MNPPFPFEQLVTEINNDPTNELLHQDVVYYVEQMKVDDNKKRELMELLWPIIKYRSSNELIEAVTSVLCDQTSDLIDVEILITMIENNHKRFGLMCSYLIEKLSKYELLNEEYAKRIISIMNIIDNKNEEMLCWLLDGLYYIFQCFDFETVPFFSQIQFNSSIDVLKRLANVLLISPSDNYLTVVCDVVSKRTESDLVSLYIQLFRYKNYPIEYIIPCVKRIPTTDVANAVALIMNFVCDDEKRKAETIEKGGVRWVVESLMSDLSEQTARNLYGYIASLLYDDSAVKQLSYDPSWFVLFAKSLLKTVVDPGCLKAGFEVVSMIYKGLPENGEIVSILAEICIKALFAANKSFENTIIVLTLAINMSVNASFSLYLLEWNLEEALDRILLSGQDELVEKGCALLMNIIVDPDAADLLCDHYILLSVDVIEKYKNTVIGARAMGCVAAFAKSKHGREILIETQLFHCIPSILGEYTLESLIDKTFIALNYFTSTQKDIGLLVSSGVLQGITRIVSNFKDTDVLEKALNIVVTIAKTEEWHEFLFATKAAQSVVETVVLSATTELEICCKGLSALINIAAVKESREKLFLLGALDAIIYAIEQHKEDEDLVKLGFGAIANMSLCEEVKEQTRENGFLDRIRPFLELHKDQLVLLKIITFLYCSCHNNEVNKKVIKKSIGDILKKMLTQYRGIIQFEQKINFILKK
ncbi:hypothetical protein KM1_086330 [Entamoeba histolytica HM-3:IMSS]|uniref:Uncharacterized protein n=1 Tax=Entamoeba histolytica HM-3:IMSS TaxID=885315 RepID=M7WNH0_ENTHI|nr:hypothetical protein KM1_086330 [Entamoeba histolytica HM-3:IMSS]